ncbi:hypothetical protein PTQ19_02300 [Microbacterium esteraromaticum]|uniref:RHS repeat domain-containing protein n=1 Tax=Microbacterium esteraromaticum TaxID=57043 RepID=UPI002367A7D8|nr:RHS repeat-associated core domain-containing protein [Microbacterium esteraromaticum]WDH79298.1 hypothetical protein PTQ19_02300 [Microbacterium esteraromaticum]
MDDAMLRNPRSRAIGVLACAALAASVLVSVPMVASAAAVPTNPKPQFEDPVPGSSQSALGKGAEPKSSDSVKPPKAKALKGAKPVTVKTPDDAVDGPKTKGAKGATSATVTGMWQAVGDTGIEVATSGDAKAPVESVTVELLSTEQSAKADVQGLALELTRADGGEDSAAPVGVRVPDELMLGQFGADYASRIQWIQVPVGDHEAEPTPVASVQSKDGVVLTPMVSDAPTMLVAASGPTAANGAGTYSATPLKDSSSWDVTEQTGAFSWTYDMAVTDPGVGPVPDLGLAYNSQAVDGLTGSSNNQPSVVGEGWELSATGFIERTYVPCSLDDGASGSVNTSGDLCWKSDNATVSFAGHSGPLVKIGASAVYRLQNDDGTRFELLSGGSGCTNGTNSSECWRMTTTDGTQYYFGKQRLPGWATGNAVTNSTWTVPVFGNDTGEPCHASTFAASSCTQAWRWNLDYIVDVHGNAQALYYTTEANKYAKNRSGATAYVRGGVLARIDYGLRASNIYGANAAGYQVKFNYDSKGRCSDTSGATCTVAAPGSATVPTTPSAYPDVPWDQQCMAASCSTTSQISPTFFTNGRLATVQSLVKVGTAYQTVNTWTLSHSFPATGDGTSPALWLAKVQRSGTAGGQAAISEPATVFYGTSMQNRVWVYDGVAPLVKWRLSSIKTGLGAVISVNYQGAQCTPEQASTILAAPESNTKWCFPQRWVPEITPPLPAQTDLFHKYPVSDMTVNATTGSALSKPMYTKFVYGTPRWRYNDSPMVPTASRTWNVFAGVDTVEVREGDSGAPAAQKVTKSTYYQGMNGDRAAASGGTKAVNVAGASIADERWFGGMVYKQQTLLGVGGSVVSTNVNTPWASPVTASAGALKARIVRNARSVVTEPTSTGGTRTVDTATTFDSTYGYPLTVSTDPSDAPATCTSTSYAAPNTTAWLIGLPSQQRTVAVACDSLGAAQYPRDHVSDVKTVYDGAAWGAAATRGLPTLTTQVDRYDGMTAHWAPVTSSTYDALGRTLVATDAMGRTSTSAYTPSVALPMTGSTVKNTAPFNWVTTRTYDPSTGAESQIVDQNGATTSISTDALGRISKVWLPLQPKAANPTAPSMSYVYTLSQTAVNSVQTTRLTGGGNVTTFELFDGLGRSVQTQESVEGGGAAVATTSFDALGRAYWADNKYWTASVNPSKEFFVPDNPNAIPSQVVTSYDQIGRVTKAVLRSTGTDTSQTVTSYPGADRTDFLPPTGGTAQSVYTNSLGQKTKLVQYLNGTVSGTGQATTYAYDGAGRMTSMTDPAGNEWRWGFNILGQKTSQSDPDSGDSTATYDLLGNQLTSTDARGKTITTTYDNLNRKTATYAGTASGAKLSAWTYDTVRKGFVTTTTSYSGSTAGTPGLAYTSTVNTYDVMGNPTKTTTAIPAGAPAFAGTSYAVSYSYFADGSLSTKSLPAAGGLPAEVVRNGYDAWGRLSSVRGVTSVLNATIYTPTGQISQFNRYLSGNGGYSTYGYDPATGDVTSVLDNAVFANTGHYVASRAYTRDLAGNVTSSSSTAAYPSAKTQKACFSYDGLRQLTRAWTPNASTACTATPSAGALGGVAPYWHDYTYDTETGNRTSMTSTTTAGTTTTSTYAYPAAGDARPHAVFTVTGGAGAGSYGYDAAGNQTTRPGQTLTFNDVGKPATITAGAESVSNVYDASGTLLLRVSATSGAMLLLGDTVLTQAKGSTVVAGYRTYAAAGGKPVAQRNAKTGTPGNTLSWLFTNIEGTVDVTTNATSGATVQSYRDPFGVPLTGTAQNWGDGTGYMNMPVTPSIKLTTVGARVYDAVLGKFTSVDPIIDSNLPQQNTGYAYSGNNPTTYTDPSGLAFKVDCGCGGRTTPYVVAPGYNHAMGVGKEWVRRGKSMISSSKNRALMPESRKFLRDVGTVAKKGGSIIGTEQGALLYSWATGRLPQQISFGGGSRITQGLRDSAAAEDYRNILRSNLSVGNAPERWHYAAGKPNADNPLFANDIETMGNWGNATDSARSLAAIGSHTYTATVVESVTANSVVVQIQAENVISLGSLLSPIRDLASAIPGRTGGFSEVTTYFTWQETVTW